MPKLLRDQPHGTRETITGVVDDDGVALAAGAADGRGTRTAGGRVGTDASMRWKLTTRLGLPRRPSRHTRRRGLSGRSTPPARRATRVATPSSATWRPDGYVATADLEARFDMGADVDYVAALVARLRSA
jgi:hypothetical protein